ncbi:hypothetical protein [Curtobacterium sp. PvP017]
MTIAIAPVLVQGPAPGATSDAAAAGSVTAAAISRGKRTAVWSGERTVEGIMHAIEA